MCFVFQGIVYYCLFSDRFHIEKGLGFFMLLIGDQRLLEKKD